MALRVGNRIHDTNDPGGSARFSSIGRVRGYSRCGISYSLAGDARCPRASASGRQVRVSIKSASFSLRCLRLPLSVSLSDLLGVYPIFTIRNQGLGLRRCTGRQP